MEETETNYNESSCLTYIEQTQTIQYANVSGEDDSDWGLQPQ